VSASERLSFIVTTHSDILVDAMTDYPEACVVCETRRTDRDAPTKKDDELRGG